MYELVTRPAPLSPLRAQVPLVVAQLMTRETHAAKMTLNWQLRGGLLHSQVADAVVLVDLTAAVRTGGRLILDA